MEEGDDISPLKGDHKRAWLIEGSVLTGGSRCRILGSLQGEGRVKSI